MMQQDLFASTAPPASAPKDKPDEGLWRDFDARLRERAAEFDLSPAIVTYAQELTHLEPDLPPGPRRALNVVILASIIEQRRGSTRLSLGALLDSPSFKVDADLKKDGGKRALTAPLNTSKPSPLFAQLIGLKIDKTAENTDTYEVPGTSNNPAWIEFLTDLRAALSPGGAPTLIGAPGDYRPLILSASHLYHQRLLYYEERLIRRFSARLKSPDANLDATEIKSALSDLLNKMPTLPGETAPMELNDAQRYALISALYRPMTLISGGPGTGKTSIAVSILRLFSRLGLTPDEVALAAPTGKAAHRLGESIRAQLFALTQPDDQPNRPAQAEHDGPESTPDQALLAGLAPARTIHRLLNYSPGRRAFGYHEHHHLPYKLLIVDEASMIDLFLMEKLLAALHPDAQLILLGDADQLPSVDAGAVFRDLTPKKTAWREDWAALIDLKLDKTVDRASPKDYLASRAVRLETSYRMDPNSPDGGAILRVARAINRGETDALLDPAGDISLRADFTAIQHRGVESVEAVSPTTGDGRALIDDFIEHWYAKNIAPLEALAELIGRINSFDGASFAPETRQRLKRLFGGLFRAQTLTATRVFATGSLELNAKFHAQHARALQARPFPILRGLRNAASARFLPGEPVIMLKNDYKRGLFNGDQGVILPVKRANSAQPPRLMAVFERAEQFLPFSLEAIGPRLEHAFALTIHKAQGSEFDRAAIVLPAETLPLFTRELLYTGITRSRHSVLLVGPRAQLKAAAKNSSIRDSGIAEFFASQQA